MPYQTYVKQVAFRQALTDLKDAQVAVIGVGRGALGDTIMGYQRGSTPRTEGTTTSHPARHGAE